MMAPTCSAPTGGKPDRRAAIGADVTPTPVSGFSFNGVSGVIGGAPLAGAYGTLQLRADGSYVPTRWT